LSQGPHLFPFRTEKLSLVEPMIVFMAKVGSRQHRVLDSRKTIRNYWVFLCFLYKCVIIKSMTIYRLKNLAKISVSANILFVVIILIIAIYYGHGDLFTSSLLPFTIIGALVLIVMIIVSISDLSYNISIVDNSVIENRLFRKSRKINLEDITAINMTYYVFWLKLFIKAPAIENIKYKNFPSEPVSDDIFKEIIKLAPNIKVDLNPR
jgi:hypothetical protein